MANNLETAVASGGPKIASYDDGIAHHQRELAEFLVNDAAVAVTDIRGLPVEMADGHSVDAFGRLRVSSPEIIFDSKLLWDDANLFWDEEEISGAGTSSVHSTDAASVVMSVSNGVAGVRVRQTFQHFNYQPGKSQLCMITGLMGAPATDIKRKIGLFNEENGALFNQDGADFGVTLRSSVTGSPVDTTVLQANWNLDKMDGTGGSGITLNLANAQLFAIDYQWLGVGRVRFGFMAAGRLTYVHEFNFANVGAVTWASTPNLPLRFEIENEGTGGVSSITQFCCTVIAEGGVDLSGRTFAYTNGATAVTASDIGVIYALKGIRLKSDHLDAATLVERVSAMITGSNDFGEWLLIFNPTVAGTFTFNDVDGSAFAEATGVTANTVTGGRIIDSGFVTPGKGGEVAISSGVEPSAQQIGSAIDGTPDEIVLCFRPFTSSVVVHGALLMREIH